MTTAFRFLSTGIVLALATATAGSAQRLLEDPGTNVASPRVTAGSPAHPDTNLVLPKEVYWYLDDTSLHSSINIGGDLFVRRDGRVFRRVPVPNYEPMDRNRNASWTEVYTGQRVKIIISPTDKAGLFQGGILILLGLACAAFGAKGMFSHAWAWKQRKSAAASEGVEAKRTPEWGVRKPLQAAFDLAVGLFALAAGLKMLPSSGPPEDPAQREVALANARLENPVEWVKQEMDDRINRYGRGEDFALPFLSSRATNISLVRVTRLRSEYFSTAIPVLKATHQYLEISPGDYLDVSPRVTNISSRATNISSGRLFRTEADALLLANTNVPSVVAVVLVDSKYLYLEIPISIFPTLFIPTRPPPLSEAEIREHLNQQVQRALKGEESDLNLSPYDRVTNIVIESVTIPTNNARTYPYRAEVVLFFEASGPNTLQSRVRVEVENDGEDHWLVFNKQGAP